MNRLLLLLIIASVDAVGMHRVLQSSAKRVTPKNTQLCLNAPRNFGTTHFILGYSEPAYKVRHNTQKQIISFSEKPSIINGSSAHLLDSELLTQSFFTTQHDISSVVLTLLEQAQKNISIAAFSLTDLRIANQLIAAHNNGIDVAVILDAGNMKQYHSKAQKLIDNGISVWRYDPLLRPTHKRKTGYEQLMHLKWIIIDDVLIQGSANLTRAAQDGENIESVTILRCPRTVEEHRQELQNLKKYCVKCESKMVENTQSKKDYKKK